jgi:hypothetical protein
MVPMPPLTVNENLWTVQQAARWSGIPYRALLELVKDGQVPCLRVGKPQSQNMGRGRKRRLRTCARFLIPKTSFVRWFEALEPPGHGRAGRRRVA